MLIKAFSDQEFVRGWRVLAAAFLGMAVCISSLVYYTSGIWIRPWQMEFGWSRAEIGLATSMGTVALVIAAPFAGGVIDRFGVRRVVTTSLLLFAAGLFGVSRMNGSLGLFYGLAIFYSIVGVASSPLAFTLAINAWFDRNRGLALGLSLASTGVTAMVLPRLITPYVAEHGWRAGYMVLVVAIMVVAPVVYLWIRDRPAENTLQRHQDNQNPVARVSGATLKEAAQTKHFWMTAALFMFVALAVGGLIPAYVPMLQDGGLTPEQTGSYTAIIGAFVIVGRLLTGFLIDRIFAPYVAAVAFVIVATGLFALAAGGLDFAWAGAVALGLGIGCEVDLIGYFSARYFGLKHYGSIYGVLYSVFQLGVGISPVIAGHIWDVTGDYNVALYGASALLVCSSVIALTLPRFPGRTLQGSDG